MFGCAPGGGPTTLLGGPLRSKAPQQTFPPASCPDGKPVPPASCPDGRPVQTASLRFYPHSVRQAQPSGPGPLQTFPAQPRHLLQTRYCAAAAPKAQPSLTHPKASTRPRHADAALSRTPPPSTPPQCRPGTAPSRHPARIGWPHHARPSSGTPFSPPPTSPRGIGCPAPSRSRSRPTRPPHP